MPRPIKQTVDYFSHDTDAHNRRTLKILRFKYKNEGYALWFLLLEILGTSEGLVFDTRNPSDWQFLVAEMQMSEDLCRTVLDTCAEIDAIDRELWKSGVVWSQNFVNRLADVYKKRGQSLPQKPVIVPSNPPTPVVSVPENPTSGGISVEKTPQSKVKNRKVKNRIEYPPISSEIKLATKLRDLILKNDAHAKVPRDLQKWADEINKSMRIDGRSEDEVARAIDFSQTSDFWKPTVLSADKLRKQMPTLLLQAKRDAKQEKGSAEELNTGKIDGLTVVELPSSDEQGQAPEGEPK